MLTIHLDDRECGAILAALRLIQLTGHQDLSVEIADIYDCGGEFGGLDNDEIDALCERVNSMDQVLPPAEPLTPREVVMIEKLERIERHALSHQRAPLGDRGSALRECAQYARAAIQLAHALPCSAAA